MKLTDLTPCAQCGGPTVPVCYRVAIETLVAPPAATAQFAGFVQMMGGHVALADAMGATPTLEVLPYGEALLLCTSCFADIAGEVAMAAQNAALKDEDVSDV